MDNNFNNSNQNLTPNNNTTPTNINTPKVDEPINFNAPGGETVAPQPVVETLAPQPTPETLAPQPTPETLTPQPINEVPQPVQQPQINEVQVDNAVDNATNQEAQPAPVNNQTPQQQPLPTNVETTLPDPVEPKKGKGKLLIIVVVVLLLAVGCWYVLTQTDLLGKKENSNSSNEENKETEVKDETSAFVGIYSNNENKLFIKKKNNNTITYTLAGPGGLFNGDAKINGDTATNSQNKKGDGVFTFKVVNGNINFSIVDKAEDIEYGVGQGEYKKVAEYNKENLYKEAVGDPEYLKSNYSGIFKNENIELVAYQTSATTVKVDLNGKRSGDLPTISETFEIKDENTLVAKDFFDENEIAYEITVNGKEFTLKCNENVFAFDEEEKKLELTYTYEKGLTEDDILKEYYSFY